MSKLLSVGAALIALAATGPALGGGDVAAGKQKAAACQACHAVDGHSTDPQFPRLDGQYADYIVKALEDYKTGARQNAIMAGFAANLTETDREDLAAYFSRQDDGLRIVEYGE